MNRYGKRCVLYPRVSTEMQVDGYSLEGQKNMLTRFADREEMIIVDIYEDAGKSGKSIEGRPAFQKMLRDIEDGLDIDYILVYKLSRFGRNAADILNSLELVQSYGVNLICIEEGIDSSQTKVIFGRYLRLNYIFKDPGDIIADNLYTNLTNKFAELRRKRGAITRAELEAVVNSAISKGSIFSGLSLSVGYSKIENGYVENEQKVKKRDLIMAGFKKAKKDIMRGWRKAYRKELIISCIFSAKRCPQCGHPMMANMMGIFGIACPNCGFNPYVTMFIFCECGAYEVVKAQPELEDDKQIQYLKEFFDGRESDVCKVCGKKLIDEYVENRIFYAPIPYPYEEIDNM